MSKKMWMVRAGRNAIFAQDFEDKEYVGVGWQRLGDLTAVQSKEKLAELHRDVYSDQKIGKQRLDIGMISRFRFEMNKGDMVVTYNPEFRVYLVGEILSDYQYVSDSPGGYNHIRKVEWKGKVKRDSLSVGTKNTVGAIMTLFLLSDSASREFHISGKEIHL